MFHNYKVHHTLNVIAICKTIVTREPIYRTYCGVYPLSPDCKSFSLSVSLSEVGTNFKEEENYEGIRLLVLFDVFSTFFLNNSEDVFEMTKLLT